MSIRKIIAIVVFTMILMNSSFCHAGNWYWSKPMYNGQGLQTMQMVKVEYYSDTNDVSEFKEINLMISRLAMEGKFNDLKGLEKLVIDQLKNSSLKARDFRITNAAIINL